MDLVEQTTQFRCWRFTADQLAQQRMQKNKDAIERIRKSQQMEHLLLGEEFETVTLREDSMQVEQDEAALSVDDELKLCAYYEDMMPRYCHYFEFPLRVKATSIMYFKRFFLKRSVMEFVPQDIMMTCLFLATKTENYYMSIDSFVKRLRQVKQFKDFQAETILHLEYVLADGLHFHFTIHHPYLCLHGLFLDVQAYIQMTQDQMERLQKTYDLSIQLADQSYLTDALFLFQPSQLAMTLFAQAAKESGLEWIESYVEQKFNADEQQQLADIMKRVQLVVSQVNSPSKDQVKEIDRRLYFWRNPLQDPSSRLYVFALQGLFHAVPRPFSFSAMNMNMID